MHVLQTLQDLVNNVLLVDVFENVSSDDCMQICVHKIKDKIDITVILSPNHILESNYVLVPSQLLQEDNLTESSLRVSRVLESIKVLLQSDNLL